MDRFCRDLTFHTSDGEFHYIDWNGKGPLVHFAHATGFCARTYNPLFERMKSRLRICGMDDRGHGRTRAGADAEKLKNWDIFAEDLAKFLVFRGEPAVLIGHSRGAVASLLLAAKSPELVKGLVLIDPTILPFSWMWWWYIAKKTGLSRFVPIAARAAKRKNIWPDKQTILETYRRKEPFCNWERGFLEGYIDDGTVEVEGGGTRLSCTPEWECRCFSSCPHDVWRFIPKIKVPTLLIHGSESDTCLASAVNRFKEKVPDVSIRCFMGASHFVPMERPDETAQEVISFLERNGIL